MQFPQNVTLIEAFLKLIQPKANFKTIILQWSCMKKK